MNREPAPILEAWSTLDAAAQVCPVPVVGMDTRLFVRLWNPAAAELLGWSATEVVGGPIPGLPETDARRLDAAMHGDLREPVPTVRLHRDGHRVPVCPVATPVLDTDGRVVGVLEYLLPAAGPAPTVDASRRDALDLLEYTSDAFFVLDAEGRLTYLNHEAERLFERPRAQVLGRPLFEIFPAWRGSAEASLLRRAIEDSRIVPFEVQSRLGHWIEGTMNPVAGGGVAVSFRDISARKKDEDRLRFLSEAGETLAGSLDSERTLRRIARLSVPFLGDVCMVDLVDERGRVRRVARAAADAGADAAAAGQNSDETDAIATVLRTGEPVVRAAGGTTAGEGEADPPEATMLVVPLLARGRLQGTLTFLSAPASGRRFGEEDVLFAQEVAARAALAVDNALLYEAAQEASQAKSNFMAVMSHELRTPLTAVIGYADLLDAGIAGALSPKQREYVTRIRRGARMQLQIIEEVLTYARVDTGRAQPVIGSFDLWELVRTTAALMKPSADVKKLSYVVELPAAAGPIESDAAKLRQVILNLLGNAVKFTRAGGIVVRGTRAADGYAIEVTDTGIGIPAEHMERIYEPFWQAEQATTRSFGGSGLGLAVVQRLVDLLGGEVAVRSSPRGTSFTVRLPLAIPRTRGAREAGNARVRAG